LRSLLARPALLTGASFSGFGIKSREIYAIQKPQFNNQQHVLIIRAENGERVLVLGVRCATRASASYVLNVLLRTGTGASS
jgi:hypothetical protein